MAIIVVCDCSPERRTWYQNVLLGHEVTLTSHPEEASRAIHGGPVDMVIVEWFDTDGPRLVKHLRRMENMPEIIFTADVRQLAPSNSLIVRAISYGASWFVSLPISAHMFRQEIAEFLVTACRPEAVRMSVRVAEPTPHDAEGLAEQLLGLREVAIMIDQTVGPLFFRQQLAATVATEGLDAAQHTASTVFEWARSSGVRQIMHAVEWSVAYGNRGRSAREELLFRIAHGMLFSFV